MPFGTRAKAFSRNPFRARRSSQTGKVEWLFVINSDVVTSVHNGGSKYRLQVPLKESDDLLLAFSDRPVRRAHRLTARQMVRLFAPGSSFQRDNPNAVLDYSHPDTGKRGAAVIKISGPSLDPTGRFILLDVTEQGFEEIDREIGSGILPVMRCVSIFIDPSASCEVMDTCGGGTRNQPFGGASGLNCGDPALNQACATFGDGI